MLAVAITEPNTSWGPHGVTLVAQRDATGASSLNGTKLFVERRHVGDRPDRRGAHGRRARPT